MSGFGGSHSTGMFPRPERASAFLFEDRFSFTSINRGFLALALSVLVAFSSLHQQSLAADADPLSLVSISNPSGERSWKVELASDDRSREIGLMHRRSMDAYTGMLFRFEANRSVAMWMKNTFIPLDMVFMDPRGTITHIHRSAVPHSLETIDSNGPALFVLEINAGEADTAGLKPGQRMRHPWFLAGP